MKKTRLIMKGSKTILATKLSSDEFDCKCEDPRCHFTLVNDVLLDQWNKLRAEMARPIKISSAYRCQLWNKMQGGVADSKHTLGMAIDIPFAGMSIEEQNKLIETCDRLFPFTKMYDSFIHVDVRSEG